MFLAERFAEPLAALNLSNKRLPDDFDLISEGVIDSFGIIELLAALEEKLGLELDFEDLDPEKLTLVGPFCDYVAMKSGASESTEAQNSAGQSAMDQRTINLGVSKSRGSS